MAINRKLLLWIGIALVSFVIICTGFIGALVTLAPHIGNAPNLAAGKKIAVLDIRGPIDSSEQYIDIIHRYRDNSSVAAVILYLDTPGGGTAATQEIYDELLLLKEEKPLIAYMSTMCASGGVFLASAADRVYANPTTLTGSIGVILSLSNYEGLSRKLGLGTVNIKSGEFKDIGSPTRKITPQEEAVLGEMIDDSYEQFLNIVVAGRGEAVKRVLAENGVANPTEYDAALYIRGFADGRIFTGKQALDIGLVDELGNFEYTLTETAVIAGIEGEPRIIREYIPEKTLLDLITGTDIDEISAEIGAVPNMELKYSLY
ncbi:MAG: signal peptide peptidase SppA [bacterium]|nr:signal peptide peptidase SppA [bacterium]